MSESARRTLIEPRPERVLLFGTCLVDQFRPETGVSVVNVLERLGIEVTFPPDQTCCGQPGFNSGFRSEAREVARRFLEVFDGDEPIVAPSGSCVAMVRVYYRDLFRNDPVERARAEQVSARLWEFSEFIVDGLGETRLEGNWQGSATYQRCCHLLRELGVDSQPEGLLNGVEGLSLRAMERSEVCCGFGGSFAVKMADISSAMLAEKIDNVEATGASSLIAGDTGCLMHMEGGLRRRRSEIQVLHIAEVLDRATSGSSRMDGQD